MNTEPVRRSMYVAAVVVALSTFFGALAVVEEVTNQVLYGGIAAALAQFAAIAFAAELARSKAWAPESVEKIIDVESVIATVNTKS